MAINVIFLVIRMSLYTYYYADLSKLSYILIYNLHLNMCMFLFCFFIIFQPISWEIFIRNFFTFLTSYFFFNCLFFFCYCFLIRKLTSAPEDVCIKNIKRNKIDDIIYVPFMLLIQYIELIYLFFCKYEILTFLGVLLPIILPILVSIILTVSLLFSTLSNFDIIFLFLHIYILTITLTMIMFLFILDANNLKEEVLAFLMHSYTKIKLNLNNKTLRFTLQLGVNLLIYLLIVSIISPVFIDFYHFQNSYAECMGNCNTNYSRSAIVEQQSLFSNNSFKYFAEENKVFIENDIYSSFNVSFYLTDTIFDTWSTPNRAIWDIMRTVVIQSSYKIKPDSCNFIPYVKFYQSNNIISTHVYSNECFYVPSDYLTSFQYLLLNIDSFDKINGKAISTTSLFNFLQISDIADSYRSKNVKYNLNSLEKINEFFKDITLINNNVTPITKHQFSNLKNDVVIFNCKSEHLKITNNLSINNKKFVFLNLKDFDLLANKQSPIAKKILSSAKNYENRFKIAKINEPFFENYNHLNETISFFQQEKNIGWISENSFNYSQDIVWQKVNQSMIPHEVDVFYDSSPLLTTKEKNKNIVVNKSNDYYDAHSSYVAASDNFITAYCDSNQLNILKKLHSKDENDSSIPVNYFGKHCEQRKKFYNQENTNSYEIIPQKSKILNCCCNIY